MQPSKGILEQTLIKTDLKVVCMLFVSRNQIVTKVTILFTKSGTVAEDFSVLMEMCHDFSIGMCIISEAAFTSKIFYFNW